MVHLEVRSARRLPAARRAIRDTLRQRGFDESDVQVLELVVAELGNAAWEPDTDSTFEITIETFAQLHSVRFRGNSRREHDNDPFHLRERVLQSLTLAFGERRNPDGTTDLWAEIPRQPVQANV